MLKGKHWAHGRVRSFIEDCRSVGIEAKSEFKNDRVPCQTYTMWEANPKSLREAILVLGLISFHNL